MLAHPSNPEDKPWVLKCPAHLGFVKDIKAVFPAGAQIIWTPPDPNESPPSLCSLFQTFREMPEGADIKLDELGRDPLNLWSEMIKRAGPHLGPVDAQEKAPVTFPQLVSDPIGTGKGLFASFGWEYPEGYEKALKEYPAENKKKRSRAKGPAKKMPLFSLEPFALTGPILDGGFLWYKSKFLT
eukprot:FR737829.1.p2 GENE.FR737829.1~~FR737829.1.p2  ORF type:complete len:184 (-),score=34.68 FR737829.1:25-576(-)